MQPSAETGRNVRSRLAIDSVAASEDSPRRDGPEGQGPILTPRDLQRPPAFTYVQARPGFRLVLHRVCTAEYAQTCLPRCFPDHPAQTGARTWGENMAQSRADATTAAAASATTRTRAAGSASTTWSRSIGQAATHEGPRYLSSRGTGEARRVGDPADMGIDLSQRATTFTHLVRMWLERGRACRSHREHDQQLRPHAHCARRSDLGDYRLAELRSEHVELMLDTMADAGLAASTMRHALNLTGRELRFGMARDLVVRNVADPVHTRPGPKADRFGLIYRAGPQAPRSRRR